MKKNLNKFKKELNLNKKTVSILTMDQATKAAGGFIFGWPPHASHPECQSVPCTTNSNCPTPNTACPVPDDISDWDSWI